MLNLQSLASSSKGNCYILRTREEVLIIECGIQFKQIIHALNYRVDNVVGCLVSHEHLDHSKSIKEIIHAGINVYSSEGTFGVSSVKSHRAKIATALTQFKVGDFIILPFDVQHDAEQPLGFLIKHKEFGQLVFITDSFYCKYKFQDLNYIMVECNYSKEILDRNIEKGLIDPALKKRIVRSHFSLANVKKFLLANDLKKVEQIYLMHLSDGNSDEKLFKKEIEKLTGVPTIIL